MRVILSILYLVFFVSSAFAQGNDTIDSFSKSKRVLEAQVYNDHRITLYCAATFNAKKEITLPEGLETSVYLNRLKRVEWEHVVAAEHFGRTFSEWSAGDPLCVNKKGKSFKGRKCAEKVNEEYRYMQSDMYNLYPAIGSVNALRSNYPFQLLPDAESDFGICEFKVENKKAEPPEQARGRIARTHQYMEKVYPRFAMTKQQQELMAEWDEMYPVDEWECTRVKRIEAIQGNKNTIVEKACQDAGLW